MMVWKLLSIGLLLIASSSLSAQSDYSSLGRKVIYAINAGSGIPVVDSHGIEYKEDPHYNSDIGIDSDYGRRFLTIGRTLSANDAFLYQTERYGLTTFGYNIPINNDGDYVLVLKFCEVYFLNPNKKIFDVKFNNHIILQNLDIFKRVGHAVAFDYAVPFKVTRNGKLLHMGDQTSKIVNGLIPLDLVKGAADNPKINAFYVMRGGIEEVPELPPLEENPYDEYHGEYEKDQTDEGEFLEGDHEFDDIDGIIESESKPYKRKQRQSRSPPHHDPYEEDDSWNTTLQIGGALTLSVLTIMTMKWLLGKS